MARVNRSPSFLLWILVVFIAGILVQHHGNFSCFVNGTFLAGVSFLCGLLLLIKQIPRRRILMGWALCGVVFCSGAFLLCVHNAYYDFIEEGFSSEPCTIVGTIIDKQEPIDQQGRWGGLVRFDIHVASFSCGGMPMGPLMIQCFAKRTSAYDVDDVVAVRDVVLRRKDSVSLSENPAFGSYLRKEGFVASVFVRSVSQISLEYRPIKSWRRWVWNLRQELFHDMAKKMSARAWQYFSMIFLGKKEQNAVTALRPSFMYWGLSHYLARSGLHIVLFMSIWMLFLSLIPVPLRLKYILLLVLCGIYSVLSWSSVPFLRAFYSFLIAYCGRFFGYHVFTFHILTLVCLMFLLFNPLQLFFLDFQLTFGLTFVLSWLALG